MAVASMRLLVVIPLCVERPDSDRTSELSSLPVSKFRPVSSSKFSRSPAAFSSFCRSSSTYRKMLVSPNLLEFNRVLKAGDRSLTIVNQQQSHHVTKTHKLSVFRPVLGCAEPVLPGRGPLATECRRGWRWVRQTLEHLRKAIAGVLERERLDAPASRDELPIMRHYVDPHATCVWLCTLSPRDLQDHGSPSHRSFLAS